MPPRISTGSTASQTCAGRIIAAGLSATAPTSRHRRRARPFVPPSRRDECRSGSRQGRQRQAPLPSPGPTPPASPDWTRQGNPGRVSCGLFSMLLDPATQMVCVESVRQSHSGHRYPGLQAGLNHLRLELRFVRPTRAPRRRLRRLCVHVPTKKAWTLSPLSITQQYGSAERLRNIECRINWFGLAHAGSKVLSLLHALS